MDLSLDRPGNHHFIRSMDERGIRIGDEFHTATLLVSSDRISGDWPPATVEELEEWHLEAVFGVAEVLRRCEVFDEALPRYEAIADSIKLVLAESIRAGGTTLRDFFDGDGKPGYFTQQLRVYDGEAIRQSVIGQRSSYYCLNCQR